MKKQARKGVSLIFPSVLFLLVFLFFSMDAKAASGDYTIDEYHIDMVVRENNTFEITEKITAFFNVEKHGIFRKLPLRNAIIRLDGTQSTNKVQIADISVSEQYRISKENGYEVIKIGSEDSVHTGIHSYTIKYTYNIGKDPLKDADELYFNLIGDQWDTSISNVTFTITMPKDFDASSLGFSSGYVGSVDSTSVSYEVDGRVISGSLAGILNEGEALTVRLTLPEGYFKGAGKRIHVDIFSVAVILFGFICVLIAARLWWKYGRGEKVIETVEFYPPEGCNSAEAQFLYSGQVSNKSIISLLVYLADKGYLKIEETKRKEVKKAGDFRLIKRKDYDGTNESERMFFEGLFRYSEPTTQECTVTASNLKYRFYRTVDGIRAKMNTQKNKEKIFEKGSIEKRMWMIVMIFVIFFLITVKPIIEYYGGSSNEEIQGMLFTGMIFPGFGFSFMLRELIRRDSLFILFFSAFVGFFSWLCVVFPALRQDEIYFIVYGLGVIYVAVLIWLHKIMLKRTSYGNEMLGKMSGFKRFLETAEKSQLESLVEENPEYFYHILPYAYALEVSDVWMKQFETIALEPPKWYDSHDSFSTGNFNSFMSYTMRQAQSAMLSSPSASSSSGSSSGGGSSGGGSGGGGGGSW